MGHSQMLQTWQNSHQNLDRKATNVNFVLTVTDAALDYAETRYVKK
jgi:DNA-dependent RNA polymerase auxiliary subunit epsilon